MGKKTKIALAVAAASAAAWAGSKAIAKPQQRQGKVVLEGSRPVVLAYRGGSHLAPENTAQAFENAAALGVDGFEVDVRLTKDEEILVFADASVDRTTNGSGLVADLTVEEIKALHHGHSFEDVNGEHSFRDKAANAVTLREVLETYPELIIAITIQDSPETYEGSLIPSKLWRLIEELGAEDRVIVGSPYNEQVERFNLYAQDRVALGAGDKEIRTAAASFTSQFGHLYNPQADAFFVPIEPCVLQLDSPKFVQFLGNLNVSVFHRDVNDLVSMNRLVRNGIKGIVTDRPDIAQVLLEKLEK